MEPDDWTVRDGGSLDFHVVRTDWQSAKVAREADSVAAPTPRVHRTRQLLRAQRL